MPDQKGSERGMWTMVFICTTIVCGIGWCARYISTLSIIYYIEKKQYPLPTDNELKECTALVIKHLIRK